MMTFLHRPLLILALALPPLGAQPTRLELGKTVEAGLAGGKTHQYVLTVAAGQFARVVVSLLPGGETVVRLSEPLQAHRELHWPDASSRPEPAGDFQVELAAPGQLAAEKYWIALQPVEIPPGNIDAPGNVAALSSAGWCISRSRI